MLTVSRDSPASVISAKLARNMNDDDYNKIISY